MTRRTYRETRHLREGNSIPNPTGRVSQTPAVDPGQARLCLLVGSEEDVGDLPAFGGLLEVKVVEVFG